MSRNKYLIIIAILCVLCCYLYYSNEKFKAEAIDALLTKNVDSETKSFEADGTGSEKTVTFYICGEIKTEGIYSLPAGSRIADAIEAAGGITESAEVKLMDSPALEIYEGQKIYVPNIADDIDKINVLNNNSIERDNTNQKDPNVIVNINTATINELTALSGIGQSTASAIFEYRQVNGKFLMIEDLKNVPGIGDKVFEKIEKNLTVE